MERGLSDRVAAVRGRIVHLEALIAHHIDFPEEDDAPVSIERVLEAAAGLLGDIDTLLATAPEGELLRDGALAVLAGRPNAGKSSLYNALLGEERAIVTEEPGTTRDALEASVQLGGYPFRLVDTAGLREPEQTVERLGIEVARRYLERADLVLLCVPGAEGVGAVERVFLEALGETPVVVVETKADLGGGAAEEDDLVSAVRVRVSVRTGEGLADLREALPRIAYARLLRASTFSPVVTRRRHARGLERARAELTAFREALEGGLPAEVASTHLRSAETAVEELLGVVSVEDVLDVVFREFCVGK
jgi:tRNA modification GTPase